MTTFQDGGPVNPSDGGGSPADTPPALDRLGASLRGLIAAPFPAGDLPDRLATQSSGGYVTIDATAADGDGSALLRQLEGIGLQHGNAYGAVASGLIPVSAVSALLGVADLKFAQEAASRTGAVQIPPQFSNGVRADVARSNYGVDGTGIKVGIISDSFNEANDKAPDGTTKDDLSYDIANDYLPQNTTILNDAPTGTSMTDEGRAMAQIVHQVAPGASILFDTGEGGQAAFAQHILDLAAAGAKIIVDDLSYFAEPDYQNGVIAQAIKTVEAQGVTYLSSAGNDGSNGYEGAWKGDQTFTYNGKTYTADQFGATSGTSGDLLPINLGPLDPGESETIYYELQWNQPAASASPGHGATGNLDLFYTDANGNVINNLVATTSNVGGDPSEVISVTLRNNGTTTASFSRYLKVGLENGTTAPTDIRIIASGDGYPVSIGTEASNTNNGTLAGHHGQEGSSAVGAVFYKNSPAYGTTPPVNEDYSSAGVDNVDYADDGTPQPRQVNTVTFSGIDGGDTSFFSPGSDAEGDNLPNFFGTSAAAPSAAAVAALMLQKNPSLTPAQIQQYLAGSAVPTSSGPRIGGTGLIRADVAVGSVSNATADQAPTATIPQSYSTASDQILSLKNTGIMVADADGGNSSETATLMVSEGVLTGTQGTSGATIAGSGTDTLVVTGSVAQIDAFFDTDAMSTLAYSDATATSSKSVSLTLMINDNALPITGGPKTDSASSTIAVTVPNSTPTPTPTPTPVPTPTPSPTPVPIPDPTPTPVPTPTPEPTPTPAPNPVPNPTPDAVSISQQVAYQNGTFDLTGTATSSTGVSSVEISALVNGARQDLGTAIVRADGTFSFADLIGFNQQSFLEATLTDTAGRQTISADPGFNLSGGLGLRGGAGRQTRYSADGSGEAAVTRFAPSGSQNVTVLGAGQKFESQLFDTFNNGAAPESEFVFNPGHGLDTVNLFRVGGEDHDTLSLLGSDFGDDIAKVLANTRNVQGGVVINDPTTQDKVFLSGVHKGQLAANQSDITFHT